MELMYVGRDPALDLVNTVDWTSRGPEQERLLEPKDLVRWAQGAGVLQRGQADRLTYAMGRHPREAERALEQARLARRVLHDLFAEIASSRAADTELARFNRLLSDALDRAEVVRTGPRG